MDIYRGATFKRTLILKNKLTGDLVPLMSAKSQIRATLNGSVIAEITCEVTGLGTVVQSLTHEQTSEILVTGTSFSPKTYYTDLFATKPDGTVLPPIRETVSVYPEVTHE